LFPEEQAKPYIKEFNAIDAIYSLLNQNVKSADVTAIMMQLQSIVNESVHLEKSETNEAKEEIYVDLSKLDFEKLKAAFAKAPHKNSLVFDLQQAIDQKLQQMLKENPLRLDFYDRYKEIVDEYNKGKSLEDTVATFEKLNNYVKDLTFEEQRAIRENLKDQETLAIFDLLSEGKELHGKDLKQVKKVAQETLEKLKAEKLTIDRWREKREVTAQVKSEIYNQLLWLPQELYTDEEVSLKTVTIYQHIYSNYYGAGNSVYQSHGLAVN
jgi:type I restriction enzyme R subunit